MPVDKTDPKFEEFRGLVREILKEDREEQAALKKKQEDEEAAKKKSSLPFWPF